ncbi:Signal transduction histidine kinase [Chryseolinea serpens]|uniref:histidine kinase n=1 Tax=Chryseolinea serpens TaxID=947013 RepID=A0A1M5PC14_9BACT|nr:ATP-binding protein [Chryseolinea serpens]SHG98999.1 Signal transduction histidine kinase [Chryseolinea serpens]
MRFGILALFVLIFSGLTAQEYRFRLYRVEQGLPSDVTKAVAEDSLNFLWMATDDGLVKYDGLSFTTYKHAFRSQYIKSFLKTRSGRLLVIGDLDVVEIQNKIDTVLFKTLIPGSRMPTDSTVSSPKSIYEDRSGIIWLGEPESVLRYDGKSIKRFNFGEANRSPIFIRSFSFFEDLHDNLYAISYQGNVFRYDDLLRDFVPVPGALPSNVNHVLFFNGKLLVASGSGLFEAEMEDLHIKTVKKALPIPNASYLMATEDALWVCTYDQELYRLSHSNYFDLQVLDYSFKGINSCYASNEGDIWASTDKGIVLVQEEIFLQADVNSEGHFVEGIAHDREHHLTYYCTKETLVELKPVPDGSWEHTLRYSNKDAYFQSLTSNKKGLWASSVSDVFLFENGEIKKQWNFAGQGNFVHDLYIDKHDNVWMGQAGTSKVTVITDSFNIRHFDVPIAKQSEINLVREGPGGMYVAASGIGGYLFFKPYNGSSFKNVSLPVAFQTRGDFNIQDMTFQGDVLWIASTEGLLRYDGRTISRVDFGEVFSTFFVSSVETLDDQNIIFSNSFGLFCYNTTSHEFGLYDENSGLPSNAITDHGISIDQDQRVWIGTSFGLAYTEKSLTENEKTVKPYATGAQVDARHTPFVNGVYAPYGSFINIQFSPITFPENKINLQWRMRGDSLWHKVDYHEVSLSSLSAGKHTVEVRAKKNLGLGWSETRTVDVYISPPFWQRAEFIMLVLCAVLLISWASFSVSSRIMQKRKEFLQNLVNKRTEELQKANEELTVRNSELDRFVYSASHDLSAPLKSILGLIRVARLDNPGDGHKEYLTMMERSVLKLEEFIKDVVSYSRNTRMPVKLEPFRFDDMVKSILQDLQYSPGFAKIRFAVKDELQGDLVSDPIRVRIVLNNLISNAIKFHLFENGRQPYVNIELRCKAKQYVIVVEDNGQGIEEKHLGRIFEMFYRATENAQGSGLGLYILKETVTKLNGFVEVRSAFGEGTIFTITLPDRVHLDQVQPT